MNGHRSAALAGVLLALASVLPTGALADERADLENELARIQQRQDDLEARYQELAQANEERRRSLNARLAELRRQTPEPRADIVRAQIELAEADDRTLSLVEGYDVRRQALERRERDVVDRMAALPPPSTGPPAATQGAGQGASQAVSAGSQQAYWGMTQIFARDVLGEELGDPGTLPSLPNDPQPSQGEGDPAERDPALADPADGPVDGGAFGPADNPLTRAMGDEDVQDHVGDYQRGRALRAYDALSPEDQRRFDDLLGDHADSPAARAALAKALASGNTLDDVAWLSGELEGRDAEWIRENTTLTGYGADGLKQQFSDSCVPTTMQAMHGQVDPVYSLRMRQAGDVHLVDDGDPEAHNERLALEQRTNLERPYDGGLSNLQSQRGEAGSRDDGGRGRVALDDTANLERDHTGVDYQEVLNPDGSRLTAAQSLPVLDASLERGIAVPMAIGDEGGAAHAVMAYDLREVERDDGTTEREYLVYDPWEGTSTWVPRSDFENHTMQAVSTQPVLYRVLEPGHTGRDPNSDLAEYNRIHSPTPLTPTPAPVREPVRYEPVEPIRVEPRVLDEAILTVPEVFEDGADRLETDITEEIR